MSVCNKPDIQFIKRLKKGDRKAFEALFNDKHQQVYAYCLTLVKSGMEAEEIMLDVFLTVWKKRAQIKPDLSLNALLFKITKDLSFNYLKKAAREYNFRKVLQEQSTHPVGNATEAQIFSEEYDQLADRAINKLPPKRKIIFTMSRQMGMSYEDIAQQLGISKNTVKVQLVKASKFLKEYVATHADISFFLLLSLFFQR
ncbi:MAG: RNA polymerase sigma-70 factor [Cyclobacteriaceae bacterium]